MELFISTYPFGTISKEPLNLLDESGLKYVINPLHRKLKPFELAELAAESDLLIAGTENLKMLLEKNKKIKMISRVGIGLDSVPLRYCRDNNIQVAYTPDAVTMAVAELTVGVMIAIIRKVLFADNELRNGLWTRPMGIRVGNSKIGIIGCGRIGTNVINLLSSFKPKEILVNDINDITAFIENMTIKNGINIRFASKEEIYNEADIISLHIPLTNNTKNIIDIKALSSLKKGAYLINLSRGGIINESDLLQWLKSEKAGGAAIDVFEEEPYAGPLLKMDNVILTQHMGSCSFDCRSRMEIEATKEVIRYFKGEKIINPVPIEEYDFQANTV